jgi:hypothetical protein
LNNGTVVAWGDGSSGETNVPSGLTNVVAIAASGDPYGGDSYSGGPSEGSRTIHRAEKTHPLPPL